MGHTQAVIADRPIAVSFERASQLTSISKSTLRRAAKNGVLKTISFGRRRIIPYHELNDLLRNGLGSSETP
jgi:excisionase family DNA binding protein